MPRWKPKGRKRKDKREALPSNVATAAPKPTHRQYIWGRRGIRVLTREPKHGK